MGRSLKTNVKNFRHYNFLEVDIPVGQGDVKYIGRWITGHCSGLLFVRGKYIMVNMLENHVDKVSGSLIPINTLSIIKSLYPYELVKW